MEKIGHKYLQAVDLIKKAILQSQYNAIRLANQEQLKLYFSIGRYISENSRRGFWGSGALDIISVQLKNDLPGLMGFGVTSLKNMRKFYEAWSELEDKSASTLAEFCRNSIISSHIPGYQNDCRYFSANLHTFALTKICRV